MKVPFTLGQVGHFGLAVRDPKASAKWFGRALGLIHQFDFNRGVAVGNDHVTIALMLGEPAPHVLQHMSFHLPDMKTLRAALEFLRQQGVELEDPGDEIGPEAPGSTHVGLWFRDLDGYRWELSVQNAAQYDGDGKRTKERVGFEPTERYERSAVFKTAALNHSAISPRPANVDFMRNSPHYTLGCNARLGRFGNIW